MNGTRISKPLRSETTFNKPYGRKVEVDFFKESMSKSGNYEVSARSVFSPLMEKAKKNSLNPKVILRNILETIVPYRIKYIIKNLIK